MKLEEITKTYEIVDQSIISMCNKFLESSKILFDLNFKIKREIDLEVDDLKNIFNNLSKYKKFKLIEGVLKELKEAINQEDVLSDQAETIKKLSDKIIKDGNKILKAIKSMDFNSVKNVSVKDDFDVLQNYMISTSKKAKEIKLNITKSSLASIFSAGQKRGLLASFDKKDWEKFNNTYLNEDLIYFNYLKPPNYSDDFEYFVYYINNLSGESRKIKLNTEQFQDYVKILYKNDKDFKDFKSLVDKYLHSNNKSLIPKIERKLKDFPILWEENEERKKLYNTLYRGIGFNEKNETYYALLDKKNVDFDFAATTPSKHTAEAFAKTGGIQIFKSDNDTRKWKFGLVIAYKVNPASIIIDFEILGSVFYESEVLINTKKAKIINVYNI